MSNLFRPLASVLIVVLSTLFLVDSASAKSSGAIVVVPTKVGGVYGEFLKAFKASLASSGNSVSVIATRNIDAALFDPKKARLIVAVGTVATRKVFELNVSLPVLGALLPRNSYRALEEQARKQGKKYKSSAIVLDQPVARHMELIRRILPNKKSLSVVLGPDTRFLMKELKLAAKQDGLRIHIETMDQGQRLIGPLNRALSDSDAFIAVADKVVSNRKTVQNLLLTTYRRRVPVIGYSRAYVRAGALAAVYSTPEQIGRQTGEVVARLLNSRRWSLPPSLFPKYYSVELNDDVARSLGIKLPKKNDVERSLRSAEGETK